MRTVLNRPDFKPEYLIDFLKKQFALKEEYEARVGVQQDFTLETHTLIVMREFEKYFSDQRLPGGTGLGLFRLTLALHDIGKPRAIKAGDKRQQHGHTLEIIHGLKEKFLLRSDDIKLLLAILNGDPIGSFLKGEISLDVSRQQILHNGERSGCTHGIFFPLLVIYYQCDVCAYTSSGGLITALDSLYQWKEGGSEIVFDEAKGRLKFAAPTEEVFQQLEGAVLQG